MKYFFKMKKSVFLALILPISASANYPSSLQIYGNVDLGITYISNTGGRSSVKMDSGISRPSRLGFRGSEDLGNGNKVSFVLESGLNVNTGAVGDASAYFSRDSYLAFQNKDLGIFRLGRQTDFFLGDLDILDSTPLVQGGMTAGINGFHLPYGQTGPTPAVSMHYPGAKFNNSLKWLKDHGGLRVGLMYGNGAQNHHDEIYAGMIRYSIGEFKIGASYTKSNYTNSIFARETFAIKSQYKNGRTIYFGNMGFGKDTTTNATSRPLEIGFQHAITDRFKAGAGFGYVWAKTASGEKARLFQPFVGVKYALSKRTDLYSMAAMNRTSNKSIIGASVGIPGGASEASSSKSMNVLRFGILHNF